MTTQPSLGQRLREWRLAKSWSIADVAAELSLPSGTLFAVEQGAAVNPRIYPKIEALIAPPAHNAIVEAATAAIKAGLDSGATVVRIVRCATPTSGRVVVIIGDDPDWRDEL